MRLTSILLLTSCALCACQAADSAFELASVPHTTRGNPVDSKLRLAVREEERSPPRLEAEEHGVLQKLRGLFGKANLPSIPAEGIQESQDSAYARGLLTLYSKLEDEFGEELDSVLALAAKQFVGEEDKPLRKLVADLLSRQNDLKNVKTAKKRLRADDSEDTRLHTLKKPVVDDAPLTEEEQHVLQKLRSMIREAKGRFASSENVDGTFTPATFRELATLYKRLKAEFGNDKLNSVLELADKHLVSEEDGALRNHLNILLTVRKKDGDEQLEHMLAQLSLTDEEHKVLDKMRSVARANLPSTSSDDLTILRNRIDLYLKLKAAFGGEWKSAFALAENHLTTEDELQLKPLVDIVKWRSSFGDEILEMMSKSKFVEVSKDTRKGK